MSFRSGWEMRTSEWCDGVIGMDAGDGVARIVPVRMLLLIIIRLVLSKR